MIKSIFHYLKGKWSQRNAESYMSFLRKQGVKIGERCMIYPGSNFGSEPYLVTIGNHVTVTSGVSFVTHDGGVEVLMDLGYEKNPDLFGQRIVGNNVFIGIKSTILPGVTIGSNVIVGAGSIVTKSVPDNSVVAGIPAKVIKTIDEYYVTNKEKITSTKYLSRDEKKHILCEKYGLQKR